MTAIPNFYPGTTLSWEGRVARDGAAVDIRADSLTWTIKRRGLPDAQAPIITTGDVATSGATGIVLFSLTDEQTAPLAAGTYVSDVVWRLANGDEYVVLHQNIVILERVSDP